MSVFDALSSGGFSIVYPTPDDEPSNFVVAVSSDAVEFGNAETGEILTVASGLTSDQVASIASALTIISYTYLG